MGKNLDFKRTSQEKGKEFPNEIFPEMQMQCQVGSRQIS